MAETVPNENLERSALHPRSVHRTRYDFAALVLASPEIAPFVRKNPSQEDTIDFTDALAVKALNRALLIYHYGIQFWDIPKTYLCPPVPGRADYLHFAADLLAEGQGGKVPVGKGVRVLDIGVGANCVFPIIGRHVYGWYFVGADIDPVSVSTAQAIVKFNASLKGHVDIRLQPAPQRIFEHVWKANEYFDLTICNPPFHASKADADAKTERKLRNLGGIKGAKVERNFGGQKAELFVDGGELAFVKRIVAESKHFSRECFWFTSIVSKAENVKPLQMAIRDAGAQDCRVIPLQQGQKQSRILAWTFLGPQQQAAWRKSRWPS